MPGLSAAVVRRIDAVNQAHPWSHNDRYRPWVLRQVPPGARRALDVGCGTGTLLRALARVVPEVHGIDRDPAVAALAGAAVQDLLDLPAEPAYDLVTAVAVVHHLPLLPALERLRSLLRPGGRLVVVGCYRASTPADRLVDVVAVPVNVLIGLARSRHAAAARVAMSAPTAAPAETLPEIRAAARALLPGARIRRRLFWRYTLVWTRSAVTRAAAIGAAPGRTRRRPHRRSRRGRVGAVAGVRGPPPAEHDGDPTGEAGGVGSAWALLGLNQ